MRHLQAFFGVFAVTFGVFLSAGMVMACILSFVAWSPLPLQSMGWLIFCRFIAVIAAFVATVFTITLWEEDVT